jgi:hypothetical protein
VREEAVRTDLLNSRRTPPLTSHHTSPHHHHAQAQAPQHIFCCCCCCCCWPDRLAGCAVVCAHELSLFFFFFFVPPTMAGRCMPGLSLGCRRRRARGGQGAREGESSVARSTSSRPRQATHPPIDDRRTPLRFVPIPENDDDNTKKRARERKCGKTGGALGGKGPRALSANLAGDPHHVVVVPYGVGTVRERRTMRGRARARGGVRCGCVCTKGEWQL